MSFKISVSVLSFFFFSVLLLSILIKILSLHKKCFQTVERCVHIQDNIAAHQKLTRDWPVNHMFHILGNDGLLHCPMSLIPNGDYCSFSNMITTRCKILCNYFIAIKYYGFRNIWTWLKPCTCILYNIFVLRKKNILKKFVWLNFIEEC